ncbi:hypothetical protein R3X25_14490 [Lutibacter sp. TH_r2]|uniref:DUF6913 domain-containing protein n=1 Tax=Lutibacter sp. TH_r2 TaxID=3082083 RepID=UPI0029552E03|nr:hypothetical protein [Lutibacter sp. TH_r2]MDV7188495.1 hypothetical protein [Lutibacter sp. TH_r2]
MIFTGFKRKTNQFFFKKKIKEFNLQNSDSTSNKVKSVLFFCDSEEKQVELIEQISEFLLVDKELIKPFVFLNKKVKNKKVENAIYPSDFGWFGNIKSEELSSCLTKKYDLLINYNKVDNLYANIVLLQCNSAFNVGFSYLNNKLYQLLISCEKGDFKCFNSELKKYLTILNKL